MLHEKIRCEKDVERLQERYEDDALFFVIGGDESEEFTLADLRYNADWNSIDELTIQHI